MKKKKNGLKMNFDKKKEAHEKRILESMERIDKLKKKIGSEKNLTKLSEKELNELQTRIQVDTLRFIQEMIIKYGLEMNDLFHFILVYFYSTAINNE
ncbi:unnamed protein product, partial [marine sediment metagenome]